MQGAGSAPSELSRPTPGLNSRIIARTADGRSVVLNDADLRRGNSRDGLHLVVLAVVWRRGVLTPEEAAPVVQLVP
jgi:hypothetical protein